MTEVLTGKKFSFVSFVGQDLSKQDLSHSQFIHCDFTDCNLEEADCSWSMFNGSNFTGAILRYTNFARSNLNDIKFYPKDAYGVIFSLECKTFKDMHISRNWWYGYIYFALTMDPERENGKDPRDGVIVSMGSDRYRRLCAMYQNRGF